MNNAVPTHVSSSARLFDTRLPDLIRSSTALMLEGSLLTGAKPKELPSRPIRTFESVRHLILWLSVARDQLENRRTRRTLLASIALTAPLMAVDSDRALTLREVFDLSLVPCRTSPILATVREAALVHLGLPVAEVIVQALPDRVLEAHAAALARWTAPQDQSTPMFAAASADAESLRAALSTLDMLWTQAEWVIEEIDHRMGHVPIGALLQEVDHRAISVALAEAGC